MKYASLDMSITEFRNLCKLYWTTKYNYLAIDLTKDFESGQKYHNKLEL